MRKLKPFQRWCFRVGRLIAKLRPSKPGEDPGHLKDEYRIGSSIVYIHDQGACIATKHGFGVYLFKDEETL